MADQSINLFQSGPLRNPEEMAFRSASSLQHHHRTEKFNSLTSPTCKQPVVPVSGMGDLPFLCQWLSKSIIVWTAGHLLGFKAGSKGREHEGGSNLLLLLLLLQLLLLLLLLFEIVVKTSPPRLALGMRARTGLSLSRLRRQSLASWLRRHLGFSLPALPFTRLLLSSALSSRQPNVALPSLPGAPGQLRQPPGSGPGRGGGSSRSPAGAAAGRAPPARQRGEQPSAPASFFHTHTHTDTRCCPPFRRQLKSFLRPRRWDVLCTVFLTRRHVSHLQDEGRQGYGWRRGC